MPEAAPASEPAMQQAHFTDSSGAPHPQAKRLRKEAGRALAVQVRWPLLKHSACAKTPLMCLPCTQRATGVAIQPCAVRPCARRCRTGFQSDCLHRHIMQVLAACTSTLTPVARARAGRGGAAEALLPAAGTLQSP